MTWLSRSRASVPPLALLLALAPACKPEPNGTGYEDDGSSGASAGETQAADDDGVLTSDFEPLCEPGATRCNGDKLETCAPTAEDWTSEACGENSTCAECGPEDIGCSQARCLSACTTDDMTPTSAGCEFIANRQIHPLYQLPDAVVVANADKSHNATVSLLHVPQGTNEEELVETVMLAPGEDQVWEIDSESAQIKTSRLRSGEMYRIRSNYPVSAYQLSPVQNTTGNESSLLLPDTVLGRTYVVPAYHPAGYNSKHGTPNYFEVIAIKKGTRVEWTPTVPTYGTGVPIKEVLAGETGVFEGLNRYDSLRVTASNEYDDIPPNDRDLSGTVIELSDPAWVVGASHCSSVPAIPEDQNGFCDPLQEQLIPVSHWGTTYVAPFPPPRGDENMYWRVYAGGRETTTFYTEPPLLDAEICAAPNTFNADDGTCTLNKRGAWVEIVVDHGVNFVVKGKKTPDDAIMLVGYLQSRALPNWPDEGNARSGDTAMYQMVPVQQFLKRYVFRTAIGYTDYAQLIRPAGGESVFIDGVGIQNWINVGDYEYANVVVTPGAHDASSAGDFGIVQIGYSAEGPDPDNCLENAEFICGSAYAHPGGMKSIAIVVP